MKRIKKLGLVLGLALAAMMPTALAKDVVVQLPLPENAAAAAPQQDFYLYVNADWLKKAKIPASSAARMQSPVPSITPKASPAAISSGSPGMKATMI